MLGDELNLHLLRTFVAVTTQKSFSRAAEIVHVSQPAVSRAVRELEEQVGMPLLERGRGQLRLTEAGSALYDHARAIFALERAAEADLRSRRGLEDGSLTIGASKTVAAYFLPPLVARFLQDYPAVDVRIVTDNTGVIEQRLLAYELDVAFVEGPLRDPRVELEGWRDDQLVVLAAAHHPLLDHGRVEPAAMNEYLWVVREVGSGTRAVTEALLQKAGVTVRRILEVGSNGAVVQSVAAGIGLAMVSIEVARDQLALGKVEVVKIPDTDFRRPLYCARLRDKPASPAARAFDAVAGFQL